MAFRRRHKRCISRRSDKRKHQRHQVFIFSAGSMPMFYEVHHKPFWEKLLDVSLTAVVFWVVTISLTLLVIWLNSQHPSNDLLKVIASQLNGGFSK